MKLNYNKFLSSGARSDLHGYNIYTRGLTSENNNPIRPSAPCDKWDKPAFGLNGAIAIGHEIDKSDLAVPEFFIDGEKLSFDVIKNYWTPAYMTTVYRSRPMGEYTRSGLISICETKAFTEDDTFISEIKINNDSRNDVKITAVLKVPFDKISDNTYAVHAKIMPGSLFSELYLSGYAVSGFADGNTTDILIPPMSSYSLTYGFAFDKESESTAREKLNSAFGIADIATDAETRFNSWIDEHAPYFECEDLDVMKVYYYRLFLIKCAIHTPEDVIENSVFKGPSVYESPFGKWFGAPVGLPVPLQIEEMKWLRLTGECHSHIENWIESRGCMKDYIQFTPYAIYKYYLHTNKRNITVDMYEDCKAYVLNKTDGEFCLPKTVGSWVTGAEYQPSFYQHTTPHWDWRHDSEGTDEGFEKAVLYRLDECVMFALNLKAVSEMARILSLDDDVRLLEAYYEKCKDMITRDFWDEEKGFFFDIDSKTGLKCDLAPCYDGFMPHLLGLSDDRFKRVFDKMNPLEFECDFSLTTVSKTCPMYWFDNCITGPVASSLSDPHLYHCCWNGPVWPFAVSLMLDSLGEAMKDDVSMQDTFLRLFSKYTSLHFESGDRSTPCIFEHYRPTDGMSFSKFNEYFHSEWINLLFSHFAGIHVSEDSVEFWPVAKADFLIKNLVIRGESYTFGVNTTGDSRTVIFEKTPLDIK